MRTAHNSISNTDSTLVQFEKCFRELREDIVGFTTLNTESLVWRVVDEAQKLGAYIK